MTAAARETAHPLFNDAGTCKITQIHVTGVSTPLAEIRTDLGESLAVFDTGVLSTLTIAKITERRVKLAIKRTPKGRYISRAQLLPIGDEPDYRCVNCQAIVLRREDGTYPCGTCHYVMTA